MNRKNFVRLAKTTMDAMVVMMTPPHLPKIRRRGRILEKLIDIAMTVINVVGMFVIIYRLL